MDEGVIQFLLHRGDSSILMDTEAFAVIQSWRYILHQLGLIGQDPDRYHGLGYGNISLRVSEEHFWISGTQTGGLSLLLPQDFARVTRADIDSNQIWADGSSLPSSEALSHAAVYAASPDATCVVHIHCPVIWRAAGQLKLPAVAADIGYGTPAMAHAIYEEVARSPEQGILTMAGHEDGLLSWGCSHENACYPIIRYLASAEAMTFRKGAATGVRSP